MDKRFFYLLNKGRHRVYKSADQLSEEHLGISVTQVGALLLINENEGCLLKDVARRLNLNNSALTGLAARMETRGLLERRPCDRDKRASRLYLTDLGRQKITEAKPLIADLNARMTEGFDEQEVAVILKFLNHLANDF
ncbi:MAG: MarR family transcriptional regulator [Gammaproteobacteria bacterium]|uniref:Transcriptional regulator, MarR family n=1 Tax=Marinobacter nitratireducens TaxID=1137280 RepID=A0A072N575_9GAMM|nr:MarR family transcriptional regulator [Marinobacter nitratireducens]KEF32641.1 Transcriptional regulator, MarR family [Marinobacter nitratireducens]TNE82448.1 MAG: MarR family transcriptional regulator [Gammaproteobacteria bacterium]TNE97951.1 MAG: MarR family transcriptional regulator [Gammaproteobacteria bacterium]